ncbi:unnamed protein product, partial [Tilletia controversa]
MCIAFGVPREESSRQSKIVVPVGGVVEDEDPEDEHRDLPVVGDWDEAEKELESAAGGETDEDGEEVDVETAIAAADDEEEAADALQDDLAASLPPV